MRTRLLSHKEIEDAATTLQYIHIYDRADNFLWLIETESLSVSLVWSLVIKPSWNGPIKFCATSDGKLYRANITNICPIPSQEPWEVKTLTLSHFRFLILLSSILSSFAKDCLLTGQEQACTRITRLVVRDHAENGPIYRKMFVDFPLVITSKVKPFSRPY